MEPMTSSSPAEFGRVDPDGTVYVRTADGERSVGQIPDVPAETRHSRSSPGGSRRWSWRCPCWSAGSPPAPCPPTTRGSIKTVRGRVTDANAVGDLDGLTGAARRAGPGDRRAARGPQGRAGQAERGGEGDQGGYRRRGREAGRRQRLARWGEPVPLAAGRVEGAAPARPGHRRRAVAPVLERPHHLHPAAQGAVRRAGRAARGGPRRPRRQLIAEAEALADSTDWGADLRRLSGPDDPVEGRRRGPARRGRRSCGAVPRRCRTSSSTPAGDPCPSRTPSSRPTSTPRRPCWPRPRRHRSRSPTWPSRPGRLPRRCSSAGRRSARCRGSRSAARQPGAGDRVGVQGREDEHGGAPTPRPGPAPRRPPRKLRPQIDKLEREGRARPRPAATAKAATRPTDSIATYREWLDQARRRRRPTSAAERCRSSAGERRGSRSIARHLGRRRQVASSQQSDDAIADSPRSPA